MLDRLYVFNRATTLIGKIERQLDGYTFQYAKSFLLNDDSIALVSNHDDHYLNHGVLYQNGEWRLSPVFDVVAGEGNRRSLCIKAGVEGTLVSRQNLLSEAAKFSLSPVRAGSILDEMSSVIEVSWESVFKENGVSNEVIDSIRWAFRTLD